MELRKKEEKKRTKLIFMRFDFLTQTKVSLTLRVVLDLNSEVLLVDRLSALLLARLGARVPKPYVQDAISNLRHPYIIVIVACHSQSTLLPIKHVFSILSKDEN